MSRICLSSSDVRDRVTPALSSKSQPLGVCLAFRKLCGIMVQRTVLLLSQSVSQTKTYNKFDRWCLKWGNLCIFFSKRSSFLHISTLKILMLKLTLLSIFDLLPNYESHTVSPNTNYQTKATTQFHFCSDNVHGLDVLGRIL